ncbi:MAG: hypothetical protein BJ554DRAFT_2928 [Olpidium bornovanus]|uniref:Uncharacterized protein n=1 Tax=Olpidium bornovanus TaxID=278681 RepID=A0A8H7ZP88_9FUNG|nr:MAG: hypothetical protein BJ554DRAFT_2928 [Olpidium bornovanus]
MVCGAAGGRLGWGIGRPNSRAGSRRQGSSARRAAPQWTAQRGGTGTRAGGQVSSASPRTRAPRAPANLPRLPLALLRANAGNARREGHAAALPTVSRAAVRGKHNLARTVSRPSGGRHAFAVGGQDRINTKIPRVCSSPTSPLFEGYLPRVSHRRAGHRRQRFRDSFHTEPTGGFSNRIGSPNAGPYHPLRCFSANVLLGNVDAAAPVGSTGRSQVQPAGRRRVSSAISPVPQNLVTEITLVQALR